MKRSFVCLFFSVIVGITVLSATGCQYSVGQPAPQANASMRKTSLDRIKETGIIRVGISPDYPPFETLDEKGNVTGFDVDLMNAVAEEMGLEVYYKIVGFESIIPLIRNEEIDIGISAISISDEREEQIAFTLPYWKGGQAVVTFPESGIDSKKALTGQPVAVCAGTTGEKAAEQYLAGAGVITYQNYSDAFQELKMRSVKAVVADIAAADEYAKKEGFVVVGEPLNLEEYAMVVNKNNRSLLKELNILITKLKESGRIEEIALKWSF